MSKWVEMSVLLVMLLVAIDLGAICSPGFSSCGRRSFDIVSASTSRKTGRSDYGPK